MNRYVLNLIITRINNCMVTFYSQNWIKSLSNESMEGYEQIYNFA